MQSHYKRKEGKVLAKKHYLNPPSKASGIANGAAGLPTRSIRDVIPYVAFLSLLFDFSILSVIFLPRLLSKVAQEKVSEYKTLLYFAYTVQSATNPVFIRDCGTYLILEVSKTRFQILYLIYL